MRIRAAALAGALLFGATALPALAHSGADRRPGATQFDLEVKISRPQQPGYDPRVVADRYGNLYAVARGETPASADDRAATKARVSSWRWTSADGGATWAAMPGAADSAVYGGRPTVATAGAHAYVYDAPLLLRYTATALGAVTFVGATPVAGPAPDAEPYLAAHGTHVFLLTGTTLYVSADGGQTFGPAGHAFTGAAGCRLAADAKTAVYVSCLDGAGHVTVSASHDDGATFTTANVAAYDPADPLLSVPPVAVTPDGVVYVLRATTGAAYSDFFLLRSADGGRTWTSRDASDDKVRATALTLSAAPDGRLGASMYISAANGERWFVGAGIFTTTAKLLVVSYADHTPVAGRGAPPPEGSPGTAFLPDSRLAVIWTVVATTVPGRTTPLLQDVWFVRSQRPDAHSITPELARTPRYEIPPCTIDGQVKQVEDWQALRSPEFRTRDGGAGQPLVAYAVDPYDPRVLYTTNGTSIARSDDGGCRWREVWSLETAPTQAAPVSAAAGRVVALAMPEDRREHSTVYAVVAEQTDGGGRAHVVKSKTGEPGTFAFVDSGLPPTGAPGLFRVSGANPDFLYLTTGNLLYASEDAGATWVSRTPVTETATAVPISALALDPKGPNNLYAVVSGALRHSRDGGRTWDAPVPAAAVQAAAGEISAVDVFHGDADKPRVAAWSVPAGSKPATVLRSPDDGATWTREAGTGLQGAVESAVHGSGPDVLVVSTLPANGGNAEVYTRDRKTHAYVDVAPVETTAPFRVSADRRGHPTFYGMGAYAVFRYAGDAIEPPVPPGAVDDSAFTDIAPPGVPPVVTPSRADVSLLVGTSRTLPFTVDLAPRRPRLDVVVLMDTSESMKTLPAVRRDLLRSLGRLARDVDLWVGVTQAKTDASAPVYRRERDVGPFSSAVVSAALDRLVPDGSGLETQLIGLDQIVTGAGLAACPATAAAGGRTSRCLTPPVGTLCEVQPETSGCEVPPGQQANFRDGALHVVVHATDATFRNPEGTPRGSDGRIDIPGVAAKYRAAGLLQVGIAVEPDPGGDADMARMAAQTGAVAPASGVACGGVTGVVPAGRPVVCRDAAHLDTVLRTLLRAHAPTTHVHVETPEGAAVSPALAAVTPEEFEDVDLTARSHLLAHVTVSCVDLAPGHYDVALHAEVHGGAATPFGIGVDCVLPAGPPVVRPPRLPGAVLPILPPVAAPAVAQPPLNVNANAQTQVQAQVQPQVGAAKQERDQVEISVASADDAQLPAELTVLAGAMGMSAAALAMRMRTGAAPARQSR
jgi:hypothetical protein